MRFRAFGLLAILLLASVAAGCHIPTHDEVNKAQSARDHTDRQNPTDDN